MIDNLIKRKILIITVSYVIGIIGGLYLKNMTPFLTYIIIPIVLMSTIIIIYKFNKCQRVLKIVAIIFMYISLINTYNVNLRYDNKYNNLNEVKCVGVITDIKSSDQYSFKYIIKLISLENIDDLNNEGKVYKSDSKLYKSDSKSYKSDRLILNVSVSKKKLEIGDVIIATGSFDKGDNARNYKGFDYNKYLRSQNICGTVKLESVEIIEKNRLSFIEKNIYKMKNKIKENIIKSISGNNRNIASALILGEKNLISDEIKSDFSESGLAHVLAISGMHLSYIIMISSVLLKRISKNKRNCILITFIILFSNLVGNSESIIRAGFMTIMGILSSLMHRKSDNISNIFFIAFFLLICNPYEIFNTTFLLSFGATIGILIFYNLIKKLSDKRNDNDKKKIIVFIKNYFKESLYVSISANIILFPILAILYNKITLSFLISSSIISLLLSAIMPLLFILVIISFFSIKLSSLIGLVLNLLLNILVKTADILSNIEFFKISVSSPNYIQIIFYYLLLLIICLLVNENMSNNHKKILKKLLKKVCIVYIIIALLGKLFINFDRSMYIYFIDVGQGDATLIVTPHNKNILIDGGGSELGEDYVGKNVLVPYLLNRRIKKIDYIIISHFDADHCRCYSNDIKTD